MKKSTIIIAIIAYAAVYSTSFSNSDLTQLGTLIDFLLSGAIGTVFIILLWSLINPDDVPKENKAK